MLLELLRMPVWSLMGRICYHRRSRLTLLSSTIYPSPSSFNPFERRTCVFASSCLSLDVRSPPAGPTQGPTLHCYRNKHEMHTSPMASIFHNKCGAFSHVAFGQSNWKVRTWANVKASLKDRTLSISWTSGTPYEYKGLVWLDFDNERACWRDFNTKGRHIRCNNDPRFLCPQCPGTLEEAWAKGCCEELQYPGTSPARKPYYLALSLLAAGRMIPLSLRGHISNRLARCQIAVPPYHHITASPHHQIGASSRRCVASNVQYSSRSQWPRLHISCVSLAAVCVPLSLSRPLGKRLWLPRTFV